MSRTETAGNLVTRAKERSDMENSNFISDAEWYRSLNVWRARLHDLLVKADPDRYTRYETWPAQGSTDYEVAADYYGTVGVDYISNAAEGLFVPLPRLYGEEQHRITTLQSDIPLGYLFVYNAANPETELVRVLPTPDRDLRHRYIVAPAKLATDGTDFAELIIGVNGLEEYIVIGMAIDARIKEQSSVVQLRESQAQMIAHLEEVAENRSIGSAGHVTDSTKEGYYDPASQRWGKRE